MMRTKNTQIFTVFRLLFGLCKNVNERNDLTKQSLLHMVRSVEVADFLYSQVVFFFKSASDFKISCLKMK
jgi:hypothetical protein